MPSPSKAKGNRFEREIVNKATSGYSPIQNDVLENMSDDGRFLKIPEDAVAEVLYPDVDVTGVVR